MTLGGVFHSHPGVRLWLIQLPYLGMQLGQQQLGLASQSQMLIVYCDIRLRGKLR